MPYAEQLKECIHDLKQKLEKNVTAGSITNAVSNMMLKQPQKVSHGEISTEKEPLDSVAGDADITNKGNPLLFQAHQSLPRIYDLSSSEAQDGDVWRYMCSYKYINVIAFLSAYHILQIV